MAEIDQRLLADLRCPQTRAPLIQVGDWLYAARPDHCGRYPILKGIPTLLADAWESVSLEEYDRVVGR